MKRPASLLAVACVLLGVGWWVVREWNSATSPISEPANPASLVRSGRTAPPPAGLSGRPPARTPALEEATARIMAARDALQGTADPAMSRQLLEVLRGALGTLPTPDVVAAVGAFLTSGADAPTTLSFAVGPGGFLKEAPSLRVFLLDYLGARDPASAAAFAEQVLSAATSPDEWAIAMRDYARARNDSQAREYLAQRFYAMISNESWLSQPSIGFLEAFDVAAHLATPSLVHPLASMVGATNSPVTGRAAYLALDRMIQRNPATTLEELLQHPEAMQARPATRGNYFARANVTDDRQRKVVEQYLLDPELPRAELEAFVDLFPNVNLIVGHNLLTQASPPDRAGLLEHDRRALRVVREWLADARFSRVRPQLDIIRHRLAAFLEQAAGQSR